MDTDGILCSPKETGPSTSCAPGPFDATGAGTQLLYVSANRDTEGTGTEGSPFRTLAAALSKAVTDVGVEGRIDILLAEGEYQLGALPEGLPRTTAFWGTCPDKVKVRAGNTLDGNLRTVEFHRVEILGPLAAFALGGLVIEDCVASGRKKDGTQDSAAISYADPSASQSGVGNLEIRRTRIVQSAIGLVVSGLFPRSVVLEHVSIGDSGEDVVTGIGILVDAPELRSLTISDCLAIVPGQAGFVLSQGCHPGATLDVRQTRIEAASVGMALNVGDGCALGITEASFSDTQAGVGLQNGKAEGDGFVATLDTVRVRARALDTSDAPAGISLTAAGKVGISRAVLIGSGGSGILTSSSHVSVTDSFVSGWAITGLQDATFPTGSSDVEVTRSILSDCGKGISSLQAGRMRIQDTVISGSRAQGIQSRRQEFLQVSGTAIVGSGGSGLEIAYLKGDGRDELPLTSNRILNNRGFGIEAVACGTTLLRIEDNEVVGTRPGEGKSASESIVVGDGIAILTEAGTDTKEGTPTHALLVGNAVGGNARLGILVSGAGSTASIEDHHFVVGDGYIDLGDGGDPWLPSSWRSIVQQFQATVDAKPAVLERVIQPGEGQEFRVPDLPRDE